MSEFNITNSGRWSAGCANEWVRGIREKPKIKCTEGPNRRFLPIGDDVIRWHLSGRVPLKVAATTLMVPLSF